MTTVERRWAAVRELVLVAALYVAYDGTRLLAGHQLGAAIARAGEIVRFEDDWDLDWEHSFNRLLVDHGWMGVAADYWYSSAHYVVTVAVLVWLYRRSRDVYLPARRALAVTTILGLALYFLLPTAPPRMLGGYVDVLSLHAGDGWWGSDASAPKGLGGLTNELAAFPSLHAGWSLWVALAVWSATYDVRVRALAWAYAAITALVVIGTANHWVVDVLVGWLVAGVGWLLTHEAARGSARRLRARLVGVTRPARARAGEPQAPARRTGAPAP
jgi:hypothetical protein